MYVRGYLQGGESDTIGVTSITDTEYLSGAPDSIIGFSEVRVL